MLRSLVRPEFFFIGGEEKPQEKQIEMRKALLKISEGLFNVGVAGFEPATPCSQSRCANRTALHPEK